jgi:hypothetical protein
MVEVPLVSVAFLNPEIPRYTEWGFKWFSIVPAGKCWNITLNQAMSASLHTLSNPINIPSFTTI